MPYLGLGTQSPQSWSDTPQDWCLGQLPTGHEEIKQAHTMKRRCGFSFVVFILALARLAFCLKKRRKRNGDADHPHHRAPHR